MELLVRKGGDAFVPPGAYRALETALARRRDDLAERPAVVLSCFDTATRLLPFVLYDRYMVPAGARVIGGALAQAGFTRTRVVYQLWNRRFRPSHARLDGRLPELLLVSGMQIHSARAFEAIADASSLGDARPLIIAGGPKAVYEPYDFFAPGRAAPDVVCTGEAFVLLQFLHRLLDFTRAGEPLRAAFDRARRAGALEGVPGLVYRDPAAPPDRPALVDTGLQRLVQHLDELPDEVSGLRLLEPPHRRPGLSPAPLDDRQVGRHAFVGSMLLTQGCRFNCPYCPIPALNQRTWRFRSPENIVRQFRSLHETFGIRHVFGADDNFFNRRSTAEDTLTALARARAHDGRPLGRRVHWGTEATQFDTHKNRDLLPLARSAGLSGIWFGIEDLTAELVNKGQKPEVTLDLFRLMHQHRIAPMAMMMYHEGQPFRSPGSLYGITNQVDFLRRAGAITVQITVHTPAVGTREVDATYASGRVLRSLGDTPVPDSARDGNHVIVGGAKPAWRRQLELLGAYASFYNPLNLLRGLRRDGSPLRRKRLNFQLIGMAGTLWTAAKVLPFLARLFLERPRYHAAPPPVSELPVRLATGAFPRLPAAAHAPVPASSRAA